MNDNDLNFSEFEDLDDGSTDDKFSISLCSSSLVKAFKSRTVELEKILSNKNLPIEEREARSEELKLIKSTLLKY